MSKIFKPLKELIKKTKSDKFMHLLVGAMFTYLIVLISVILIEITHFADFFTMFALSWASVMIVSVMKEKDDDVYDKIYILYAMLGWLIACVTIIPFALFA